MRQREGLRTAVVVPVGPGKDSAVDTLQSVEAFCRERHVVIVVDDQTNDGTREALATLKKPHWQVFRNTRRHGISHLVHTLCFAYQRVIQHTGCDLILRLDQDALVIKPGLLPEALAFMDTNPAIGIFGVYDVDYNRPRTFESHRRLFDREAAWYRSLFGWRPSWKRYLSMAEGNGYERGDNVFGGAYFITRSCLVAADQIGALNVPWNWHSKIQEDVYFSMVAVAAGFRMGHFAAPDGPLCLEWRGLPFPASALAASKYKLVHSVDKGPNTGPDANGGKTAREVFRAMRPALGSSGQISPGTVVKDTLR
jgi:glycosyltransferase involved in cell wall biosynthesis